MPSASPLTVRAMRMRIGICFKNWFNHTKGEIANGLNSYPMLQIQCFVFCLILAVSVLLVSISAASQNGALVINYKTLVSLVINYKTLVINYKTLVINYTTL